MNPVLGRLTDECTLITSSTGITLDRMATGTNKVIELRQFDDECIPIVFVEWTLLQIFLYECRFKLKLRLFLKA